MRTKIFSLVSLRRKRRHEVKKASKRANLFSAIFLIISLFLAYLFTPRRDSAWHIACVTCKPKIGPPFFIYISLIAVIPSDSLTSTAYVSLSPGEKNRGKKRVTAAKR